MKTFRWCINAVITACVFGIIALLFTWDFSEEGSWMVKVLIVEMSLLAVVMQKEVTMDYMMEE